MLFGRAAAVAALVAVAASVLPAAAQQAAPGSPAVPRLLNLQPPPADIVPPPNRAVGTTGDRDRAAGEDCAPAWPCRLQLFGIIQRNGGVGLKGSALTW
jgi:hypothetical protein